MNLFAVIVAAVAFMILGMAWYSPMLFGKLWMNAMGKTEDEMKNVNPGMSYMAMTVLSLFMAYVLAYVLYLASATDFSKAVVTGFWVWLGFIIPVSATTVFFEGRSLRLFILNAGYYLVGIILMSALLSLWI